jgi:hypothetical protein
MNGRGFFSASSAQVAQIGDIMFEGHWRWVSNLLQATSLSVQNINRNAYPGVARAGSGSGESAFESFEGGYRRKLVRSRFNR